MILLEHICIKYTHALRHRISLTGRARMRRAPESVRIVRAPSIAQSAHWAFTLYSIQMPLDVNFVV